MLIQSIVSQFNILNNLISLRAKPEAQHILPENPKN